MSLLPSKPDTTAAEDAEPRVVGVESDDADDLLSALSSETARRLLGELHESPAPPAELAERVDTSLQNAQYHLENLQEAGAVEVVDTAYSQKGREMDVYAPADQPLVIFAGDQEKSTSIRTALSRLLGAVGLLAVVSLVVSALAGRDLPSLGAGSDAAGEGAAAAAHTPTPAGVPAASTGVVEGLGPGAFFFLGGAAVLAGAFAVWYVRG
ncbi:helix-turn-helix transcriptional regulator [Halosimplex rubrum]|uniref:Helix-turn-helix transcriptional regulator n=1 Tax=Halosimplex rubrum TaxID=869889 RepID=A0A7D5NYI5_9EURY|nr:helix-turn-helix domain-containing protein [Halosimplex rubrum]QLH76446.1 helix-turn-helix transcriptional regulator [Halosimplex rubrum]